MVADPVGSDALARAPLPRHAVEVVGRLVPSAFAVALGTVLAVALCWITLVPAVSGDPHLVEHVGLLSQYLYGYQVSFGGAVLGALYGFVIGSTVGYAFARVRNFGVACYLRFVWRRAEQDAVADLLDHL